MVGQQWARWGGVEGGYVAQNGSRVLFVSDFGGDPTGVEDSLKAINAAIAFAYAHPARVLPGDNRLDLGWELVLDGVFVVSGPIKFPATPSANLRVSGGELRAMSSFPKGQYLLDLTAIPPPTSKLPTTSTSTSTSFPSGTATGYDFFTFTDLVLDGGLVGGGVWLENCIRVTVSQVYFLGYGAGAFGVRSTEAGGAIYVTDSYFSGFDWPNPNCSSAANHTGGAISFSTPDNMIDQVIVACSDSGLYLNSGAIVASNVHVFGVNNSLGKGFATLGTSAHSTRLLSPYVDWSSIHVPFSSTPPSLTIANGFFLGDTNPAPSPRAYVVLHPFHPNAHPSAFSLTDSIFHSYTPDLIEAVALNESTLSFDPCQVSQFSIARNAFQLTIPKTTTASSSTFLDNSPSAILPFPTLLFNQTKCNGGPQFLAALKQYPSDQFALHRFANAPDNAILFLADKPINGTVHVTLDQQVD